MEYSSSTGPFLETFLKERQAGKMWYYILETRMHSSSSGGYSTHLSPTKEGDNLSALHEKPPRQKIQSLTSGPILFAVL